MQKKSMSHRYLSGFIRRMKHAARLRAALGYRLPGNWCSVWTEKSRPESKGRSFAWRLCFQKTNSVKNPPSKYALQLYISYMLLCISPLISHKKYTVCSFSEKLVVYTFVQHSRLISRDFRCKTYRHPETLHRQFLTQI